MKGQAIAAFVTLRGDRQGDEALAAELDRLVAAWVAEPFSPVLAVEHAADHPLEGSPRWKRFGQTMVSIYEDQG